MDNPKLFYVDFDKISLSLKTNENEYFAYIDAGRNNSFLLGYENFFELENDIESFNSVLREINLKIFEKSTIKEKIIEANKILCDKSTYSFEADGSSKQKAQIRTSYGALVNGFSVCEGYSKSFKLLMDEQNIECIEVIGYIYNSAGAVESHACNKVKVLGKWYLVNSTLSDSSKKVNDYVLLGNENCNEYKESKTISNSGFEFSYPTLASFDYGTEEIKTEVSYASLNYRTTQIIDYSYKNYSSAKAMKDDGLYIVARHEYFDDNGNYVGLNNGFCLYVYDLENTFENNSNVFSAQFFATTQVPDMV